MKSIKDRGVLCNKVSGVWVHLSVQMLLQYGKWISVVFFPDAVSESFHIQALQVLIRVKSILFII